MKLAALFAKYLYRQKVLRLPGLGIFTLDPSVPIPDVNEKNYLEFTRNIQFTQQSVAQADEDFINFIRTETGKIKPLAESDLDSFLSDGKILLNIGKPFNFEGIGALQKSRDGHLEFTPGDPSIQKAPPPAEVVEETNRTKSFYSDEPSPSGSSRKILITLGIIAGLVLVVWLGYKLANRNTTPVAAGDTAISITEDSSSAGPLLDSVRSKIDSSRNAQSVVPTTGNYRFTIERTANKARALRRFSQIKENLSDIRMQTRDSSYFSLYFIIPAQPSDTARIRDSLKVWYGRKQVWVEKE